MNTIIIRFIITLVNLFRRYDINAEGVIIVQQTKNPSALSNVSICGRVKTYMQKLRNIILLILIP